MRENLKVYYIRRVTFLFTHLQPPLRYGKFCGYKLIERFSEDVDVSIEKEFFGFTNQKDPENVTGANKQRAALTALSVACADYVGTKLLRQLQTDIEAQLGTTKGWSLFVDPEDPQTLQFEYPSQTPKGGYIKPSVKIEAGARSEHWPVHEHKIQSYVKDALKEKGHRACRCCQSS